MVALSKAELSIGNSPEISENKSFQKVKTILDHIWTDELKLKDHLIYQSPELERFPCTFTGLKDLPSLFPVTGNPPDITFEWQSADNQFILT